MKNIREKQRLEFVDSAYEERWREECDDARELRKALTVFMAAEREKQIEQKKQRMLKCEERKRVLCCLGKAACKDGSSGR